MLKVLQSNVHGRGCVATENIPKGTLITVDIILFPLTNNPDLSIYSFPWSGKDGMSCICTSPITFSNHSQNPNIKIYAIDKENLTKTFLVLKDINVGDELFLHYNKNL